MATTKKNNVTFYKQIFLYGLALGGLFAIIKLLEFNLLVKRNIFEVYAGIVALIFCGLGIWVGLKFTTKSKKIVVDVRGKEPGTIDDAMLEELGISKREYEVLQLIAKGMTNKQVADVLFVSENTIKTHIANLFAKLDVNRRTQAVQRAKELNILG